MKAAVVREPSGPFVIEDLRDPEPKQGEILVKVAACGVCHTDLHIHDGSVKFPFPCVLGHEVSGTVLGVGGGVDGVAPGDRIAAGFIMPCGECRECRGGREELCESFFAFNRLRGTLYDGKTRLFDQGGTPISMYSMGGLAELVVMPERAAAPLPDGLDLTDSAILGCALLTAYGACHHVAELERGESVAVVGTGGVGSSIIQLARASGASEVIAVDIDDEKLKAARAVGATSLVNASRNDAVEAVRDLTEGSGAEVVFEAIGNPATFTQATEMAADGGCCVMIGIAPTGVMGQLEITRLVRRKLRVLGSFGGRPRRDLPALMEMVAAGRLDLRSLISRRFPLAEAGEAYSKLANGEIVGRAVIDMAAS